MRVRPSFAFLRSLPWVACALGSFACADVTLPPRIFVSAQPSDVHVAREDGATMPLNRWDLDPHSGLNRGYWLIGSEHEWRALWPSIDADRIPLLPPDINFTTESLLVAAPTDPATTDVRIHAVIDTAEAGVHVYLSQNVPGQGCPPPQHDERVPVSAVRVPHFDKEVHFHVELREDSPCEAPPEAKIGCRMNGPSDAFSEKLVVEPGATISCLSQGKPGMRPTVDRTWSFRSLPMGTAAKMTMAQGGAGVSFPTDAFGTYSVGLDVTDDLGRTSRATSEVQVAPPKSDLVVQMLWTKFDPNDDPTTFPRVELHVVGDKTPIPVSKATTFASRNQPWILVKGDCTVTNDKPPPWCRTRVVAQTSIESLTPDAFPQYRFGVKYLDDRYEGQPVLCVRAFRGPLSGEWCDKAVRSEGSWWDVARVDAQTGKVPKPPTPPAALAAPMTSPVAPAAPFDPSKPRKPGDPWVPTAAASAAPASAAPAASGAPASSPKPKATSAPASSAAASPASSTAASPASSAANPASSATPAKARKPGDPWTP